MSPKIQLLGVYKVEPTPSLINKSWELKFGGLELPEEHRQQTEATVRDELSSVYLIEVIVQNRDEYFNINDFTQSGSDQVAYNEIFLTLDGCSVLSRFLDPDDKDLRIAFFLHFFDPHKPLQSSYGELEIPSVHAMPQRLINLAPYNPVD